MLAETKIAIIGSGVMAEAMIAGLLKEGMVAPDQIVASGPRAKRGDLLREKYGVQVTTDNVEAPREAGVVVLSVKPQMLASVMEELKGKISEDALVLSIVAGVRMTTIEKELRHTGVVRAMPNTPAQVGEGITVWIASDAVSEDQRNQAAAILATLGQEILVDNEDYLDMATALSGTGPSYVFLLMEAMVDAGVHLGFPRYIAEKLVLQTVKGSAEYALQSSAHLARLRNQVTSSGGTAAEALYYLEKAGIRPALSRAIWAAYQRSISLGEGKKKERLAEDHA